MKYVDEFRNRKLIAKFSQAIKSIMPKEAINIMEVCGTHTQSFCRFGLDKILPKNLRLISGPGCPVCVSAQEYIDTAIQLTQDKDIIVLTFGDMLRIPGTQSTLEIERAKFGNVRVVYSAIDSIKTAKSNPNKKIVFLAVGFETTAPTIALSILAAKKEKLKNLFFLTALKLIPPAMLHLLKDRRVKINAFLCPGHVSAIIGMRPYDSILKKYNLGCCISGFEPLDILESLYLLVRQIVNKKALVENQYSRVVNPKGNLKAQEIMRKVFTVSGAQWRGLGNIAQSGLIINKEFADLDARSHFSIKSPTPDSELPTKCRCADILKGLISPLDCPLFRKKCSIDNPIGPCMVTSEGACNVYYRFNR